MIYFFMARKIKRNNKIAFWAAMFASFFLLISGSSGISNLIELENIVLKYLNLQVIKILFTSFLIIASFGALSVFAGGIFILKNKVSAGRLFIALGSGAGIIGLIFNLLISSSLYSPEYFSLSFSSLGVIFAILSQIISRKNKKSKFFKFLKKVFR